MPSYRQLRSLDSDNILCDGGIWELREDLLSFPLLMISSGTKANLTLSPCDVHRSRAFPRRKWLERGVKTMPSKIAGAFLRFICMLWDI